MPVVCLTWLYHTVFTFKVQSIWRAPQGWQGCWKISSYAPLLALDIFLWFWPQHIVTLCPCVFRSRFLPHLWTRGCAVSLQQLLSVSSCQPHKFKFTGGKGHEEDKSGLPMTFDNLRTLSHMRHFLLILTYCISTVYHTVNPFRYFVSGR